MENSGKKNQSSEAQNLKNPPDLSHQLKTLNLPYLKITCHYFEFQSNVTNLRMKFQYVQIEKNSIREKKKTSLMTL